MPSGVVGLLYWAVLANAPLSGQAVGYRHEVLWDFEPAVMRPNSRLLALPDGSLLGQTPHASNEFTGSVFRVTEAGRVHLELAFDNSGPRNPSGGLCIGPDGTLYGASFDSPSGNGALFRITAQGVVELLHQFLPAEGNRPNGDLVLGADGALYGTCVDAGAADANKVDNQIKDLPIPKNANITRQLP